MPNCKEHEDCDLVCTCCGDYYCQGYCQDTQEWAHIPRQESTVAKEEIEEQDKAEMNEIKGWG